MNTSNLDPAPFEIKVVLVGYVSVGKTTVLNALLGDKFSEVSMRRTTAGVSNFRLNTRTDSAPQSGEFKGAQETLKTITEDNETLRQQDVVEEKTFDIEIAEQLCEMRSDTRLTIVDIPGINEAGASSKYRDYVIEKWHTFDCIVAVMDARQGVNTEEQLGLLELIKDNCQTIKEIPVIILCNKVDESEDKEQQVLVS